MATKQDYERIAAAFKDTLRSIDCGNVPQGTEVYFLADRIAAAFQRERVEVDRIRFMRACGFDPRSGQEIE